MSSWAKDTFPSCDLNFGLNANYRPFMLRHLLAEKQLRGSKRLPKYAFSASKEKSHYNLKNVKVWRPWGRIFSPICPTSRPYTKFQLSFSWTFRVMELLVEEQGIGRTRSMNASSRTSSYFMSGSGNSITFQNGPWTWTFGQNIKFTFKFILSPFNKQESYHFHKKIGIWRRHFRWYLVNKTVCCSQMCSTYQKYFGWCQSW